MIMEDVILSFRNSLTEIMLERNLTIVELAKGIWSDPSTVRKWFDRVKDIKLSTLLKLADYFNCSLEYLCGKTHDNQRFDSCPCKRFGIRIKEIISEYKLIPYNFLNEIGVMPSRYYYWLSGGEPMLTTLNIMANHLGITLDKLVGREK